MPNETYHELYERCNQLPQEYISQCHHMYLCPCIKLLQKFLTELIHSSIYIQYLLDYETKLIEHIENYGDSDYSVPLPFTMKQVYDYLQRHDIQDIPQQLRKAKTKACTTTSKASSSYSTSSSSYDKTLPIVANCETPTSVQAQSHFDIYDDLFSYSDPEICAFVRNKKNICECCMTGPHPAECFFFRGPNFRPKELEQRINLYNKQHGSKPPEGKDPIQWNPRSLNPTHRHTNTNNKQKNLSCPFENYDQKNNNKKSISFMSIDEEEPIDHNELSAMISNQANIANIVHDESNSDNYFGENIISVIWKHQNLPTSQISVLRYLIMILQESYNVS